MNNTSFHEQKDSANPTHTNKNRLNWNTYLIEFKNILFNPLSPNSDQHQFSPNNIHMLPRGMVMTVNKMITKEKMLWSVIKLSQLIL